MVQYESASREAVAAGTTTPVSTLCGEVLDCSVTVGAGLLQHPVAHASFKAFGSMFKICVSLQLCCTVTPRLAHYHTDDTVVDLHAEGGSELGDSAILGC